MCIRSGSVLGKVQYCWNSQNIIQMFGELMFHMHQKVCGWVGIKHTRLRCAVPEKALLRDSDGRKIEVMTLLR